MKPIRIKPIILSASFLLTLGVHAWGQNPHPDLKLDPFFFQCRLTDGGEEKVVEVALNLPSQMMAGDLNQVVALPGARPPIRLKRYLPVAEFVQNVIPDESPEAVSGILLAIEGRKNKYERWLIAGNQARNRLSSLIGSWRYMTVLEQAQRNNLFEQYQSELDREPVLTVSSPAGNDHDLAVHEGETLVLDESRCTIRIKKFFPHYASDPQSKLAVNQSDKRLNPAALVEVEVDGRTWEFWVFARFPDFNKEVMETLPCRITLDCPLEGDGEGSKPDFVLITILAKEEDGDLRNEVWQRNGGKISVKTLNVGESIEIPGSRYTFRLIRIVPRGRLVEEYRPSDMKQGVATVLQIETVGERGEPIMRWLELDKNHSIASEKGPLSVMFGSRKNRSRADSSSGHSKH